MKYKHIKEKMRKAEMNGIMNEYDVYQSKVIIAESYLVDRTKVVLVECINLMMEATNTSKSND